MSTNFLKVSLLSFLYLSLAVSAIVTIGVFIMSISLLISDFNFSMMLYSSLGTGYIFNYFIIIRKLIAIIKTTYITPFVLDNVKSFKIIGCCLGINRIFEFITGYKGSKNTGIIHIFQTEAGAITPTMIVCLISALMCFVIAEVFDKAIKIKEDNDLTI